MQAFKGGLMAGLALAAASSRVVRLEGLTATPR